MFVYKYDAITNEYIESMTAIVDKVASRKAGKQIYFIPAFATLVKPPKTKAGEVAIFSNGKCSYNPQMIERTEKEEKEFIKSKGKDYTHKKSDMFAEIKSGAFFHTSDPKYKYPVNLLNFNARSKECNNRTRVHPTQKPVALLEYLIKTHTNEGDLVLDFTMGSGSTGVACLNTNRRFVGIELDEKYFNISKERMRVAVAKNRQKRLF